MIAGGCGLLLLLLPWGGARAEVYQFVDEDGVLHFTNVPTDERYRPMGDDAGTETGPRKAGGKRGRPAADRAVFKLDLAAKYEEYIQEAASRFNIPGSLIRAVMAVESNFNAHAVSSAGAEGLMQLMPFTAEQMGVTDTFDPRQSILGGTKYLRTLANSFEGDLVLTLAAYNAGQSAVNRHMDIPPFAETQSYVRRVLKLYYFYKEQNGEPAGQDSAGTEAEGESDP